MDQIKHKAGKQTRSNPLRFRLTDGTLDRTHERVIPKGGRLDDFKKNPVALFGHHSDRLPIGKWVNIEANETEITAELEFPRKGSVSTRFADDVRALVEQRILTGVSIGFRPEKWGPAEDDKSIIEHKEWTLLEASVVPVPANQNAGLISKALAMDIDPALKALISGDTATKTAKSTTKAEPGQISSKSKARSMSISDKIIAAQDNLDAVVDSIEELESEIEAVETPSEDQLTQLEALTDQKKVHEDAIASLKRAEGMMAANKLKPRKKEAEATSTGLVPAQPRAGFSEKEPGELFIKQIVCRVKAHQDRTTVAHQAATLYNGTSEVEQVLRAATTEGTTQASGWASELVADSQQGFIDLLDPGSIYGPLSAAGMRLQFGRNGTITIPGMDESGRGSLAGQFVGEGVPIPVKEGLVTSQTIARYKMGVISTFTQELLEQSTPSIEAICRERMLQDSREAIDAALLDGNAGSAGVRPPSIVYNVTGQASAGNTVDNILTDLKFLVASLNSKNGNPQNYVLIMHSNRVLGLSMLNSANNDFVFRDEVQGGSLLGIRVIASNTAVEDEVFLVDASSFYTGLGSPDVRVSDTVTLTMANEVAPAPQQPIRVDEAAGTTPPTEVHSLFQQHSTAIRLIIPLTWATVRPMVERIHTCTW